MAIREIRIEGDEILRKKSRVVTAFDEKLSQLIDDMFETMYEANGVGLAAPQVGILKRIVVIDTRGEDSKPIELVNPEIVRTSGKHLIVEGCLSVPGVSGYVNRPEVVQVKGFNRKGEPVVYKGNGLLAQAFCHECEHLDGGLFIDKVEKYVDEEE